MARGKKCLPIPPRMVPLPLSSHIATSNSNGARIFFFTPVADALNQAKKRTSFCVPHHWIGDVLHVTLKSTSDCEEIGPEWPNWVSEHHVT